MSRRQRKSMPKPRNAVVMHARKKKAGPHGYPRRDDKFEDDFDEEEEYMSKYDMNDLISRAEAALAFLSEEEVAEVFRRQGIPDEDAFLAIKAAQVNVSPDKPVVH